MLKIKGALVYDGTGKKPCYEDILLNGDKISEVAPNINISCEEIDASGFIATPGFVDVHRHLDFNAFTNEKFGELELLQGICTSIGGNCGLAPFPSSKESQGEVYSFLQPCLGKNGGYFFSSAQEYFSALEKKGTTINVGMLAATGAIKAAVKGFSNSPYTTKELSNAQALLCQTLEAGAVGISCGIMYSPECYTSTDEYVSFLSPAAKYGRILTSHIRGEGDGLLSSLMEIIDIAKRSGLPLNISHFKAVGKRNWKNTIFKAIELIEKERASGFPISADFYPFTGGATTLMSLIPPSFNEETTEKTIKKLETISGRDELKNQLSIVHNGWDNMVLDIGWDRIIISGVTKQENKKYCLKSIKTICEEYNFSSEIDFISWILCEEKGQVSIIVMSMHEDDLMQIAALPYTALISDALYGAMDTPHPRLFSSFPKFIKDFVLEKKLLPLEVAINKMTAMPAARFSMQNKGNLTKGADADILLFKPECLGANATFATPNLPASGMNTIILGGKIALKNDVVNHGLGKVIRALN